MFDLGYRYPRYGAVADEVDLDGADPLSHAMNNMKAFIRDLEIGPFEGFYDLSSVHDLSSGRQRGGLRYTFRLRGQYVSAGKSYSEGIEFSYPISMPGVHVERVRYVADNQDPEDYLTVRVDGESMTWIDALNHIHQEQKS